MGGLDHRAVGRPEARAGAAWESETQAGWPGAGPVRPRPGANLTSAARVNKTREVRRPTFPSVPSLSAAVERFLARSRVAARTRQSYAQDLAPLCCLRRTPCAIVCAQAMCGWRAAASI